MTHVACLVWGLQCVGSVVPGPWGSEGDGEWLAAGGRASVGAACTVWTGTKGWFVCRGCMPVVQARCTSGSQDSQPRRCLLLPLALRMGLEEDGRGRGHGGSNGRSSQRWAAFI